MTEKDTTPKKEKLAEAAAARREFLTRIGKGSATIPAAVLLLAANASSNGVVPSGGSS